LDLEKYGFEKLFNAKWIYLEVANFKPKRIYPQIDYGILKNEEGLSAWRMTRDSHEELGKGIFDDKLLNDHKVKFVAGYQESQILSGCFMNQTKMS
jgi:hypothetical protein